MSSVEKITPIHIQRLGKIAYRKAWEKQKDLQQALISGNAEDTLLICEHEPVLTKGKKTKDESLITSQDKLKELDIELIEVERGGDITYHGPGQVVLYPIIDLNLKKRDVDWYMRGLEQVIISVLSEYGIEGMRVKGKTGVWIQNQEHSAHPSKIASIGVRISRWRTLHGLALNVKDCSDGFSLIHPCGYHDIHMTSLEYETKKIFEVDDVADNLVVKFCETFEYQPT